MIEILEELFSSYGRANRQRYFWHIVLDDVVGFTLIVVTLKRLHDLGRPSVHWLLCIPLLAYAEDLEALP